MRNFFEIPNVVVHVRHSCGMEKCAYRFFEGKYANHLAHSQLYYQPDDSTKPNQCHWTRKVYVYPKLEHFWGFLWCMIFIYVQNVSIWNSLIKISTMMPFFECLLWNISALNCDKLEVHGSKMKTISPKWPFVPFYIKDKELSFLISLAMISKR